MRLRFAGLALIAAATTIPSQIKVRAGGTGALLRFISAKLNDQIEAADYATGDGSTDDTTALQNAIADAASNGKPLHFAKPTVSYRVTGTLSISVANTRVWGDGAASKIFPDFSASLPVGGVLFDVTASGVEFVGLAIDASSSVNSPVATINHYAIRAHGTSGTHLTDITVRNCVFNNLPWNDTLGAVVTTHATYFSWVDRLTVLDNTFESPAGAAVFMSGVTGFRIKGNNIDNTGWYSIHANDVVSQGTIEDNRITGSVAGSRVWGGSINLMSNNSTGTACGTQSCAQIHHVEIAHNYISGVHSYTAAVHIESSSHISFHDNILENITLTLAADMVTRYGVHVGSSPPFYADGSPANYVRPYVRPTNVPPTGNEGPNDHIDISHNFMTAGSIGAIAVFADAQDNGSGTLPYSDTLTIQGNQIQSLDSTHYFSTGIFVHGQQGGWKSILIDTNSVSGFPDGTSPNGGLVGTQGLVAAPVLDATITNNIVTLVGGAASTTTHLGIGVGGFTTGAKVVGNTVNAFWDGIRTFANSSSVFIGANTFTGSGSADYLISPSPAVPFGVIPRYASFVLASRSSNLVATTVASLVPVGDYRLCASARTITSGTGTTATLNLIWTDEGGAKTDSVGTWALNAVDVTGQINKCEFIHSAVSTNIQVSVTAGTYGTSAYAISATVEKLN